MWNELEHPGEAEAKEIIRQALRYCPEFPFEPAVDRTREASVSFYDDYRLVRLAPAPSGEETSMPDQEVYGFYAPGDFCPLDPSGRAIERLNEIVPLELSYKTALEYTLLRLEHELPRALAEDTGAVDEWRRAKIVSSVDALPNPEGLNDEQKRLAETLSPPEIRMVPEWDSEAPENVDRGKGFRIRAFALVYTSVEEWKLVEALAQVSPDGVLTVPGDAERFKGVISGKCEQPVPLVLSPLRTQTAMPIQTWHVLDVEGDSREGDALPDPLQRKVGDHPKAWVNELHERYEIDTEPSRLILRVADLPFYTTFFLLEVLKQQREGYQRTYALIRPDDDEPIRPLNGTSPVIHRINAEDNELDLEAEGEKEGKVNDYLRFFCWAVHAEGGPFYIPHAFREIPLQSAPSVEKHNMLKGLSYSIKSSLPEIGEDAIGRETYVVHDTGVFEAQFAIQVHSGMVEMVNDELLVEGVSIHKEKYGEGGLFELHEGKPSRQAVREETPVTLVEKLLPHLSSAQEDVLSGFLRLLGSLQERSQSLRRNVSSRLSQLPPEQREGELARFTPEQRQFLLAADAPKDFHQLFEILSTFYTRDELSQFISTAERASLKDALDLLQSMLPEESSGAFLQRLAEEGSASSRDVKDPVVFNSTSSEEDDSHDADKEND